MEQVNAVNVKDEITDVLNDLNLEIDVDVAFLAGQTPPIKIFPTPNTSQLPYNEQLSVLESEYQKYYAFRGDLKYNEKMARSIGTKEKSTFVKDDTCMYRIFRDRSRFFETRIKDDVLILGRILESMIERSSEMEKHLEKILLEAGETNLPIWDELFEEAMISDSISDKSSETECQMKNSESNIMREQKVEEINVSAQLNQSESSDQLNGSNQQNMTHEQAQMLVAQMMLARSRSFPQSNRLNFNSEY